MKLFFFGALFLFSIPLSALGAGIFIEEVLFDPEAVDTGKEFIAIKNSNAETKDLSGWQLYPDGIGYYSFPSGFSLAPGSAVFVRLRASGSDSQTNLHHSSASSNMGNTSGSAALFSGEPRGKDTIQSFVQWGKAGKTWESAASDAGLWQKGTFIDLSSFSSGNSIMRVGEENGQSGWRIAVPSGETASPESGKTTPENNPSPPLSENSTPPPPLSPTAEQFPPLPSFSVYAGEDREGIAGSPIIFDGALTVLSGSLSEDVRFFWDFGDGKTVEGTSVSHIFSAQGIYRVGLHVSHKNETQSDYVDVRIVPNQITPPNVIEKKGENTAATMDQRSPLPFTADNPSVSLETKPIFSAGKPSSLDTAKIPSQNSSVLSSLFSEAQIPEDAPAPLAEEKVATSVPEIAQVSRAPGSASTLLFFGLAAVVSIAGGAVFLFLKMRYGT